MHNQLCSILVILLFFCSTFSMEQPGITEDQKKLVKKYAPTFKDDVIYFMAVDNSLWRGNHEFEKLIKYGQLGQKVELMRKAGIDENIIKHASGEYIKHREKIKKCATDCNYYCWKVTKLLLYLGVVEILLKHYEII